jgi:hypothetical protein
MTAMPRKGFKVIFLSIFYHLSGSIYWPTLGQGCSIHAGIYHISLMFLSASLSSIPAPLTGKPFFARCPKKEIKGRKKKEN